MAHGSPLRGYGDADAPESLVDCRTGHISVSGENLRGGRIEGRRGSHQERAQKPCSEDGHVRLYFQRNVWSGDCSPQGFGRAVAYAALSSGSQGVGKSGGRYLT